MRRFTMMSAGMIGLAAFAAVSLANTTLESGVKKGGMLSAFTPTHVTGADKDTQTCPVCKYPLNPAVQVWINKDDEKNVESIVSALEKESKTNAGKKLKAFVIFINPDKTPTAEMTEQLQKLGEKEKVNKVALAFLPGPDHEAVSEYKINTDDKVKNTVFVYRNRKVDTKFVNFVADKKGLAALDTAIQSVVNQKPLN